MTIRYEYKCSKCLHEYVEQRGQDEPNPYFSTCHSCKDGEYEETNQEILSEEPERVSGPIVETVIEEVIPEVVIPPEEITE